MSVSRASCFSLVLYGARRSGVKKNSSVQRDALNSLGKKFLKPRSDQPMNGHSNGRKCNRRNLQDYKRKIPTRSVPIPAVRMILMAQHSALSAAVYHTRFNSRGFEALPNCCSDIEKGPAGLDMKHPTLSEFFYDLAPCFIGVLTRARAQYHNNLLQRSLTSKQISGLTLNARAHPAPPRMQNRNVLR